MNAEDIVKLAGYDPERKTFQILCLMRVHKCATGLANWPITRRSSVSVPTIDTFGVAGAEQRAKAQASSRAREAARQRREENRMRRLLEDREVRDWASNTATVMRQIFFERATSEDRSDLSTFRVLHPLPQVEDELRWQELPVPQVAASNF